MKGNLLIVDDEELLLQSVTTLLKDSADHVFTAQNGEIGLDILGREKIHCVVCDINMPKMNGIEFVKKLRAKNNNVPFIFYSAHGSEKIQVELKDLNILGFVSKVEFDDVEELVEVGLKKGLSL